jgi:hypothetical protein
MRRYYEAATEICGSLEQIRQELDYLSKQLDGTGRQAVADRRERIATAAMVAFATRLGVQENLTSSPSYAQIAERATKMADALLAELDKLALTAP